MKHLVRIVAIALSTVGLSLCAFFGAGLLAFHFGLSRPVAFVVAGAFALVCLRAGFWLWEGRTFQSDLRRAFDVLVTAIACLGLMALAQLGRGVGGSPRFVLELLVIGIGVIVYFGVRRTIASAARKPKP
jgi:uncharacterized membrane protein YhfC